MEQPIDPGESSSEDYESPAEWLYSGWNEILQKLSTSLLERVVTSIKPVAAKPRERLDGIESTFGGLDSDSEGHRSDSKGKSIEGIIAFGSARQ